MKAARLTTIGMIVLISLFSVHALKIATAADGTDALFGDDQQQLLNEANDTVNQELSGSGGITPDSPLWNIERTFERLDLALTIDPKERAQKDAEFARERLLEARRMAEKGDIAALEKAKNAYDEHIASIRVQIRKMKSSNPQDDLQASADIEQELSHQEAAATALSTQFELSQNKGNMKQVERENIVALVKDFGNESTYAKSELQAERQKTKLRLRAEQSLTEEQVNEIEEETSVRVQAERFSQKKDSRSVANETINIAVRAISQANDQLRIINDTEKRNQGQFHSSNATSLVEQAQRALSEGQYRDAQQYALEATREARNSMIISKGKVFNAEERQKVSRQAQDEQKRAQAQRMGLLRQRDRIETHS